MSDSEASNYSGSGSDAGSVASRRSRRSAASNNSVRSRSRPRSGSRSPSRSPSKSRSSPKTLADKLKEFKVAKASDAKNLKKLSPSDRKRSAELKEKKQVGFFLMPDAPKPTKGKRKRQEHSKNWIPCPLLPGVPAIPPPHKPQPWEILRDIEKKAKEALEKMAKEEEDEEVVEEGEGEAAIDITPTSRITVSQHLFARKVDSGDSDSVIDITEQIEEEEKVEEEEGEAAIDISPTSLITFAAKDQSGDPDSAMDIDVGADDIPLIIIPGPCSSTEETIRASTSTRTEFHEPQFSPSTGIVQCTEPPQNLVMAEIELLGFTPSSTNSIRASGSGRSDIEMDVTVVIERDFGELNDGSDVEVEDITLVYVDDDCLENPALAQAMLDIDTAADTALHSAVGQQLDLLHFDWLSEAGNFEGVRECFAGPSGPTFNTKGITPLESFLKIWDANIIAHIVRETNKYASEQLRRNTKPNSRINRWKDVTDKDMKLFFSIIMLQSLVVNNVEREYWYPKLKELHIGNFGALMPFNRFQAIKRCLHFVDNNSLPEHPDRLHKIMPIIEHLNRKFSSLYLLEQNVAIDESLLLWKGRVPFSQKISNKKAKVGIKSYELCESRTGYLWRFEVYSGKGHVHTAQVGGEEPVEESRDEPDGATSQIVLSLMRPLFNKGHTLVMDNFYNAPLLSRILKVKHNTDSMGTLRLNREFVPEALKGKTKVNMKPGEVAFSTTKDLSVVVWMDKNVTAMISTFHPIEVGGVEKHGNYRYKPKVILDYNLSMGGIDHKDQMLHAFPIERLRNSIWYKKLFRRLLNVSIHNAFVIFNHNRTQVLGNREFRLQLAKELLDTCRPEEIPRPLPTIEVPPQASQMHLPVKNAKKQRCKMCAGAKVRRSTMYRCSTCAVNLCIETCYVAYHNEMSK